MIRYSAAQAISPAINRTRQYLLQPFLPGRFLKLTLVALITEGGISSCNYNWHTPANKGGGLSTPWHLPHLASPPFLMVIGLIIVASLIMIPLWLLISYLVIRLRFSYFDCVLRFRDRIGPAWAIYHQQAMRYLGLSIVIGLAFTAFVAAVAFALYSRFKPLFLSIGSDHPPNLLDFLPLIAIAGSLLLLLAIAGTLIEGTASYFVLPRMALEDATIQEALSDVWSDIRDEPWQFAFFFLLRFLLTLAASLIGMVALAIPVVIVVLIGVALGLALKAMSGTLLLALGIPVGIVLGAILLLAFIGLSGAIGTFRRNYALVFCGGRYPLLASLLAPAGPVAPVPPPWPAPGFMPPPQPPF